MNYEKTAGFEKNFKHLLKKFRTLEKDLETYKNNALETFHGPEKKEVPGIFQIPGFESEKVKIFKITRFSCRALKGRGNNSGIRIIYGYFESGPTVEFVEMYFKADQANHDEALIRNYIKAVELGSHHEI